MRSRHTKDGHMKSTVRFSPVWKASMVAIVADALNECQDPHQYLDLEYFLQQNYGGVRQLKPEVASKKSILSRWKPCRHYTFQSLR